MKISCLQSFERALNPTLNKILRIAQQIYKEEVEKRGATEKREKKHAVRMVIARKGEDPRANVLMAPKVRKK